MALPAIPALPISCRFYPSKPVGPPLKATSVATSNSMRSNRESGTWHPEFQKYMQRIVKHPNYAGMPGGIVEDGKVRWNAPSHRPPGTRWSNLHDEREEWWRNKAKELGIPIAKDWISEAAKRNHPFREKPCQVCGAYHSLRYEYPTRKTIDQLNSIQGLGRTLKYEDFQKIGDTVKEIHSRAGKRGLDQASDILGVPASSRASLSSVLDYIEFKLIPSEPRGRLSPGAMSNAPDRLDGFHTYNICHRPSEDTGRTRENLKTYGMDRRAFEYWVEGDWAAADYMMKQTVEGVCEQPGCGRTDDLTADHVGPLSLGFCHRPKFRVLCRGHNSARNNRLTYEDILLLVHDEKAGEKVVSWQSKYLWDAMKGKISNDVSALNLAEMLRLNEHHFLNILARIKSAGCSGYLESLLHPEYASNKYRVQGELGLGYAFKVVPVKRAEKYAKMKTERTRRIALQSLDDYAQKHNRRVPLISHPGLMRLESDIIAAAKSDCSPEAYGAIQSKIEEYLRSLGDLLMKNGVPRGYSIDDWGEE